MFFPPLNHIDIQSFQLHNHFAPEKIINKEDEQLLTSFSQRIFFFDRFHYFVFNSSFLSTNVYARDGESMARVP